VTVGRPTDIPHGFVLSDSALYSFKCQDVFPDIVSFAAAIPDHLKSLFLIPIQLETLTASVAARVAARRRADGATPTGDTETADLFGTKTFVNDDNEPTVPSSDPGSMFDVDGADSLTHHQEYNFDENVQAPTDTSYMSDIDVTQYTDYPYRQKEKPRHSTVIPARVVLMKLRLALKPEELEARIPEKVNRNSKKCTVALVSYDKKNRVFSFAVDAGNGAKDVKAALSDIDEVAMSCNCPFWRYNGPEFHAKENSFMLGQPFGTSSPPNIRDPDRKYWLCKHAAAALKRLDFFVQEIVEENWDLDDDELMRQVDEQWDRLEGAVEIPDEELVEDEEIDIDVDWDAEPEGGLEPEEAGEPPPAAEEESYDVDLSELDEEVPEEHPEVEVDYEALEEEPTGAMADAEGEPEVEVDYEAPEEETEEAVDYEAPEEPEEEEPEPEPEEEEPEEEPEPEEEEPEDYSGEEEQQEQ
jgi:hypothetical protein